jgi:SPP1 gp7 family putative phage head morphogenesis protein
VFPAPPVVLLALQHKVELLLQEEGQMQDMARRWLGVESALEAQMTVLAEELAHLRDAGKSIEAWRLFELERYRALLSQAEQQITGYSRYAGKLITGRQEELAGLGIEHAAQAIRLSYLEGGGQIGAYFNILPVEAVEQMIGFAGDGSPLNTLLRASWPDAADGLTQALIDGTALGRNPRDVAKDMVDGLSQGLDRMLTIARTEQLRTYREASRSQYQESGLVNSYKRIAASDSCIACLALDGEVYPVDEPLEIHPNDRCGMIPVVEGLPEIQYPTGEERFAELSEDEQRSMMGAEAYDLYANGQVSLRDFAVHSESADWGPSIRTATLADLTG